MLKNAKTLNLRTLRNKNNYNTRLKTKLVIKLITSQNSVKPLWVLQFKKKSNLPFRNMTGKMARRTVTNDHESSTEMIILSDLTIGAGFILEMWSNKLRPLLERLPLLCSGFKKTSVSYNACQGFLLFEARDTALFWSDYDCVYMKNTKNLLKWVRIYV